MTRTGIAAVAALVSSLPLGCDANGAAPVVAARETAPVAGADDAADDACIWIDPAAPERSTIIGTDKESGGLYVYDLDGELLQVAPGGELNNVDLRHGFRLGGDAVALVVAGDRTDNRLAIYRVDPATRELASVAAPREPLDMQVYGSCMYRSAASGETYVFVDSKSGLVRQLLLRDDGGGGVAATLVRELDVGGQVEGCVADDELGDLYVGEEEVGIWRYGAEPDAGGDRVSVDRAGERDLVADVEGLAIYRGAGGAGYLLASSQGNSTFTVYDRGEGNQHLFTFTVVGASGVDAVSDTDGIEVSNVALGPAFPDGLFVAQDGDNDGDNQNFKLVSWGDIAGASDPPLLIDTTPRNVREEP